MRRSGEEGGTHRTYGTHGTVADGTTGHKRQRDSPAVLHTGSTVCSALFEYFEYFVVSKIYAGSP